MFEIKVEKSGNEYVSFDRITFLCQNCNAPTVALFKNQKLMGALFIRKTCGTCFKSIPDIEGCILTTQARIDYLTGS